MSRWLRDLARLQRNGETCVVVTVTSTRGSVPREAGTRMLVTADRVIGTIGGGHLEFKAIGIARDMLVRGGVNRNVQRFPLGASLGQCCGGLVNLLFETVTESANWVAVLNDALTRGERCVMLTTLKLSADIAPPGRLVVAGGRRFGTLGNAATDTETLSFFAAQTGKSAPPSVWVNVIGGVDCLVETLVPVDFHVVLFGAGHVARSLVRILAELDCAVTWVDARENELPVSIPENVTAVLNDAPTEEVGRAPSGSYFLVMTHSHPLDQLLAEAILRRGDFAYFGLIGSLTKRKLFEKRLGLRGIGWEKLTLMTCPIGHSTGALIQSKQPMAIAVAVAAELIALREKHVAAQTKFSAHDGKTPALEGISGQKWPESRTSA